VGAVVPSPIIIAPSVVTARAEIALVPFPKRTPPSVSVVAPVPPLATAIVVPFQTPVDIVPTLVRLEFTTPLPKVVALSTLVPLISYSFDDAKFTASSSIVIINASSTRNSIFPSSAVADAVLVVKVTLSIV